MNLEDLLRRVRKESDIEIVEQKHSDGTVTYVFSSALPFPKRLVSWYPITVLPGQTDIPRNEIEGMLRHLWWFQLDFFPDEE